MKLEEWHLKKQKNTAKQFSVTEHDQNRLFSAPILSKNPVKSRVLGGPVVSLDFSALF